MAVNRSVRDVYPNWGFGFSTSEQTVPERAELEIHSKGSTASVETENGPRPVRKADGWHVVIMVGVAVGLLVLLGQTKGG